MTPVPRALRNVTVLTGNGLSVAFNPELALWKLCQDVMASITAESYHGDAVTRAMKDIAEHIEHTSADSDFEVLVGAFVSLSGTLDRLLQLASSLDPADEDQRRALVRSALLVRRVRDNGISHVLELIAKRSTASPDEMEHLYDLVNAIAGEFGGRVTFGNLNYDCLLLAALSKQLGPDLCDMADGRVDATYRSLRGWDYVAQPLRTSNSFPRGRRIRLLHLHGSLTYWSDRKGNTYKLKKETVEQCNLWSAVRDQSIGIRPEVILANQHDKSELVKQQPYALAYETFAGGLDNSDHWLIIGYSFRDIFVNETLRAAFGKRRSDPPKVLVVTFGDDPTEQTVLSAFDWVWWNDGPADWLTINRDGANAMVDSVDWKLFSGQFPTTFGAN